MLKVWGRRNSMNVQKVMWAIGELGLEYTRENVAGSFGGLDTEEYKALNPNQVVPVLQDGDTTLWESNAIVRYLAAQYGEGSLWPQDPAVRAVGDKWMDWLMSTLGADFMAVFFGLIRTPPESQDLDKVNAAAARVGKTLGRLDTGLDGQDFVAGNTLTMGDIPLGVACYRYYQLQIERPSLPNVEAWYQRLQDRPAYQEHVMIPFGTNLEEWQKLEREGA